ncbi:MMPL family transporter [Spirillospora sp. NPDC052242]
MPAPRAARWSVPALLLLAWLVVGGVFGPYAGKLGEVSSNDQSSFLPTGAESTRVLEEQAAFERDRTFPAIVVWTSGDGGVTPEQRAAAARALGSLRGDPYIAGEPSPPIPARDGAALQAVVQIPADAGDHVADTVDRVRAAAEGVPGTRAYVGGPAATQADLGDAFAGIDVLLLGVAVGVVLLILLVVYRSVLLPLMIILGSVFALALACAIVYGLAERDVVTVDGQVQGILFILVIGACTDYALLLSARYREELAAGAGRLPGVLAAWRGSAGAIAASAGTVAAGLLALLLSDLSNNRALGPVGAIGIGCALLSALTFLPAVLALLGRAAYWPAKPHADRTAHPVWERVARLVDHRPRRLWAGSLIALVACAAFMPQLRSDGVPLSETFVGGAPSVTAQEVLDEHFPGGQGNPAVVLTDAAAVQRVVAAAERTDGVHGAAPRTAGRPGAGEPLVVDGRALVDVTLSDAADSEAARDTVERLRGNLHGIDGTLVGGYTAQQVDTQAAAQHDRTVIVPVVLAIIVAILVVLLRSLLMPLLLVATVALNYLATLGVSALVFRYLFGFTGTDASVPLYGFVFLVALGVDYNIFLMTRVREESLRHGPREGVLRGLTTTGGVITSAGVVLAATFAALVVIPLAFLVQIAFIVAFGVLLDTLVVRSLLVPALVRDAGPVVWWPGSLWRRRDRAPAPSPDA